MELEDPIDPYGLPVTGSFDGGVETVALAPVDNPDEGSSFNVKTAILRVWETCARILPLKMLRQPMTI